MLACCLWLLDKPQTRKGKAVYTTARRPWPFQWRSGCYTLERSGSLSPHYIALSTLCAALVSAMYFFNCPLYLNYPAILFTFYYLLLFTISYSVHTPKVLQCNKLDGVGLVDTRLLDILLNKISFV